MSIRDRVLDVIDDPEGVTSLAFWIGLGLYILLC